MPELKPSLPVFNKTGRWTRTATDSIVASWAGSSISFLFSGKSLSIRSGPQTERKDPFNGGTPMLACTISNVHNAESIQRDVKTYGAIASGELSLYESREPAKLRLVELTLIDWASVFELESIIVESTQDVSPLDQTPSRILVIGDSIACGYTDGTRPIPHGCLNAFPFLLRRRLADEANIPLAIDLVAFPGLSLIGPPEEDAELGSPPLNMVQKFNHASPWNNDAYEPDEHPSVIIVALGTNDEAQDVPPGRFTDAMLSFVTHLVEIYQDTLKHVCLLPPFPDFNEDETQPSLSTTFAQMKDRLTTENRRGISFHTWDVGKALSAEHSMDGLHPTVSGQEVLAEELGKRLQPLLLKS